MTILTSVVEKVQKAMLTIAGACLAISTLLASINTIMRYTVGAGFAWSEEITTYLVVYVVFFGITYLEYTDGQLSIDITNTYLKNEKILKIIAIVRKCITIAAIFIIMYYNILSTQKAFERETTTSVLNFPRFMLYGVTVACLMVTLIGLVVSLITLRKKEEIK